MTRKDYNELAAYLSDARREIEPGDLPAVAPTRDQEAYYDAQQQVAGWRTAVEAVAHVLARDNPRFDRARFLAACER